MLYENYITNIRMFFVVTEQSFLIDLTVLKLKYNINKKIL